MKVNVRLLLQTALLLVLCVVLQFLRGTAVYVTETIVSMVLIISVLSAGFLSAAVIAVLLPLFSWWIIGSAVLNAHPVIVLMMILGNLIQVGLFWFFAVWLSGRMPAPKPVSLSDPRFRRVLLTAAAASVLWGALSLAFLSSFASVLQLTSFTPALVLTLVMIAGVFLIFVCLWALFVRCPRFWAPVTGLILSSAAKALFLWLTVNKGILTSEEVRNAGMNFSVTPLLTALLGSLLACLIWIPIKKHLTEEKK